MRIITLASDVALGRLRPHIGVDSLVDVATVEHLHSALLAGGVKWVILDPMMLSESGFQRAVEAIASAGVSVAFYTTLAGFDHDRLLKTYDHLLPEVVFRETDDDWVRLRNVLRSTASTVPARILRAILGTLGPIREPLRGKTASQFAWARIPSTVEELAVGTDLSASRVRHQYRQANLCAPEQLLVIARLARAYDWLADRPISVEDVARECGFGTVRAFERRMRACVDATPSTVASNYDRAAFATKLAAQLTR